MIFPASPCLLVIFYRGRHHLLHSSLLSCVCERVSYTLLNILGFALNSIILEVSLYLYTQSSLLLFLNA